MKNLFSGLLLLLPSLFVAAQDEGEVIVIAELNRAEVRQFIEEAEDQFYAIFNANLDDDSFKISCRKETPVGTNIPVRVCEPEFMIAARAENARNLNINFQAIQSDQQLRASLESEFQQLQAKMEEMTRAVPEFAQIASILTQLRARQDQLTN